MDSHSIEEALIAKMRELPPEKQRELLDFAGSLDTKETGVKLNSARGLWKNLGFTISDEDIAQTRKEMWGNFPREQFFK
jgi:hypothetical protein